MTREQTMTNDYYALLFGLIGALSPCQLSSNLAALAWVSHGVSSRGGC